MNSRFNGTQFILEQLQFIGHPGNIVAIVAGQSHGRIEVYKGLIAEMLFAYRQYFVAQTHRNGFEMVVGFPAVHSIDMVGVEHIEFRHQSERKCLRK